MNGAYAARSKRAKRLEPGVGVGSAHRGRRHRRGALPPVTPVDRLAQRRFTTTYALADNVTYVLGEVWGQTYAESVEKVYRFLALDHSEVAPVPQAGDAIAALRRHYRLVVVTSRDQQVETPTLSWLSQHFPGAFEDVIFAGNEHTGRGFRSKPALCQDLGAVSLIDDSAATVEECASQGIPSILFGDYPWNQLERLPAAASRAHTWKDVTTLLLPQSKGYSLAAESTRNASEWTSGDVSSLHE